MLFKKLYSLPPEIGVEVCNLLTEKDIVKLDTASCCRSKRKPLELIFASMEKEDLYNRSPSALAFMLWCLRNSVRINQLHLGPADISALLSDVEAMPDLRKVKQILLRRNQDDNSWPVETVTIFNVLTDQQTIVLDLFGCYQQEILDAFLAAPGTVNKKCSIFQTKDIGLFIEDRRIWPFLYHIGSLADYIECKSKKEVFPSTLQFLQQQIGECLFPKLEDLFLPWKVPVPWLQSLLRRCPSLKKLDMECCTDFGDISNLHLKSLSIHELKVQSTAAGPRAFRTLSTASPLCLSLESLTINCSYLSYNRFSINELALLQRLTKLFLYDLYCHDEDLLFVLRQLPNVSTLHLYHYSRTPSTALELELGGGVAVFRTLFGELNISKSLGVTFDLPASSTSNQALIECFPINTGIVAPTEDFDLSVKGNYYDSNQLQAVSLSFARMIASGRFANLQGLKLNNLVLKYEHFEAFRDGCAKLKVISWDGDGSYNAGSLDRFPQGWKCLVAIYFWNNSATVTEAGLRQISSCCSKLTAVTTQLQVIGPKELIIASIKRNFPKIIYNCK